MGFLFARSVGFRASCIPLPEAQRDAEAADARRCAADLARTKAPGVSGILPKCFFT